MTSAFQNRIDRMIGQIMQKIQIKSDRSPQKRPSFSSTSYNFPQRNQSPKFTNSLNWSPQHEKRIQQKQNSLNLSPITFVNIKNARYQLPSSINSDHELNIKDIQFPTFRSRRLQKGKGKLVLKNNELSFSTDSKGKQVKKSNVKLSWNKYINLNNIKGMNPEQKEKEPRRKVVRRYAHKKLKQTEQNIEGWQSYLDDEYNQLIKQFQETK